MKLRNKKTGEVKKMWKDNICLAFGDCNKVYYSLTELNEEWEDVEGINVTNIPLIKDEKIRKAVRGWAEACEIESDDAIMLSDLAPAFTRFYTSMYEIDIKTESSLGLDEHRGYTIAELCGEEEE